MNSLFSNDGCVEKRVCHYYIKLGLQKKNKEKYAKLILCMDGFHIAQNLLGAIGHLMQSTGIEDIMVEADVCLHRTANKIIS